MFGFECGTPLIDGSKGTILQLIIQRYKSSH